MTMAEELIAQGFEQGFEQGLELSRRELASRQRFVLGLRKGLEHVMTLKFGPLPEAVSARIQAADHEVLDRWLDRLGTAATPGAVVELTP